jgi:hypothetical protein
VTAAKKGGRRGKLSSFRSVEQLLYAGSERHAIAAAIAGSALILAGPILAIKDNRYRAPQRKVRQ